MRALAGGLLVLVLLVTGAMPTAAGGSGPRSGPSGKPAGSQTGGGHKSNVSAKQASASKPSARKSQQSSPRPAPHNTPGPKMAKASAAAPPKPSTPNKPTPAEHKPEQDKDPAPDREPDQAKQPREGSKSSVDQPRLQVRSSGAAAFSQPVSRVDRPRAARAVDRPVAAVVASAADPSAALFAPPPVVEIQAAAVELEPRQIWPRLPGPAGHPAFPGLLAAVLLGFIFLGFRGDRRDPKLAAAAIDDRDDRAEFR